MPDSIDSQQPISRPIDPNTTVEGTVKLKVSAQMRQAIISLNKAINTIQNTPPTGSKSTKKALHAPIKRDTSKPDPLTRAPFMPPLSTKKGLGPTKPPAPIPGGNY